MPDIQIFENAKLVLKETVSDGWVVVCDGIIAEVGGGRAPERGVDCTGDLLIPGLVELHTDHLETHLRPRPKVDWPVRSALIAYDVQLAGAGITTVFDSLRVGSDADYAPSRHEVPDLMREISAARQLGLLRVDHHTHLRCEICANDVLDAARTCMEADRVDLISLMDHTPGARQFASLDAWRIYYGGKTTLAGAELDRLMARKRELFVSNYRLHRDALVSLARQRGIAIASHDDSTSAHVTESIGDQVSVAEFPTTMEAACLSHAAKIAVLMGAPNVVRGGSHAGNVAAESLAREGVLDILSSDYVPASLLMGAFDLVCRIDHVDLPQAIRMVSLNPARAAGLDDRGEIAPGQRADLVRVKMVDQLPVVREVFRDGHRIV